MKLNELVCPTCGLKCLTDIAYTTCASCGLAFNANQSRSVDFPSPIQQPNQIIPPIQITPWPVAPLQPQPPIVNPNITYPYFTWEGGGSMCSTGGVTDGFECQVWN